MMFNVTKSDVELLRPTSPLSYSSTKGNITNFENHNVEDGTVLTKIWNFLVRETLAEIAWIRSRGLSMWLFNDHLLFILASFILLITIVSMLIGKVINRRRKRRLRELTAVTSDDYIWYRSLKGEPMTRNTAYSPVLPKFIPAITICESSVCLIPLPDTQAGCLPQAGKIEVCTQNVPAYLLPTYEPNQKTEIPIPYTPSVMLTRVNQPGSPSKQRSPRISASSPAIMKGLWGRLEKALRTKIDENEIDSPSNTKYSKSDEEVPPCSHDKVYQDTWRQKNVCYDCQRRPCSHHKVLDDSWSRDSFGFEDIDLEGDQWPSYMYPTRGRFDSDALPTRLMNSNTFPKVPRLSTFPVQCRYRHTYPTNANYASQILTEESSSEDSTDTENETWSIRR